MFDVKKHLIKIQGGRLYLPVAARLIWFRTEHPDWAIDTRAVAIDVEKQYAIFESSVFNAEGKLMAKGTKMENIRGFGDWLEKAETGAIGRALAVCGFGTQFAPDLDEASTNPSDEQRVSSGYKNDRVSFSGRNMQGTHFQQQSAALDPTSTEAAAKNQDGLSLIQHDEYANANNGGQRSGVESSPMSAQTCDSCNAVLKPSQLSLSLRKYGAALCPDCQRKHKADMAA